MTQPPLTGEQAAQLWRQLHQAHLAFAALRQAAEDSGVEVPEDVRRQLMEVRQQLFCHGVPWELIDAMSGLQLPADD